MVADKGKKVKVSPGDENSEPELFDGEIINSIVKLQLELDKINEEASEEVLEVEQEYNEVRRPIYERRSEIIKSIPDFWLSAFLGHPALATLLTEEDQKIFKFFSSLEVEECKDVKSEFPPESYFEDTKLTKTYTYLDEGITNVTATEIKWKEGMGIQNGVTRKKGKKRSLEEESFFHWFSSSKLDNATEDEVAEIIKDDFWPCPLTFFNNDSDNEEDGHEDDDDEEINCDDDEDNDDEEEDDDEDEGGN